MHSFLYSPVVKAKANDLLAITDTRASTLHLVRPIVEPIVLIENAHATTNVLRDSDLIARLLPNIPFYFDPLNFESPARAIQAFELLARRKSCFTPLVQLNHSIPLPELRRVLILAESTYAMPQPPTSTPTPTTDSHAVPAHLR